MGGMMGESLENEPQSDYNRIHIDIHNRKYYPDDYSAQTVTIPDGTIIPILYDGILTYIPVRIPLPI